MHLVYSNALMTYIWLGDKTNKTKNVMKLINALALLEYNLQQRPHLWYGPPRDLPGTQFFTAHGLPSPLTQPQEWMDLLEFFRLKWFRRVWIIQEVILSKV